MYCVYDRSTETVIQNGFDKRQSAKELRGKLNLDYYPSDQFAEIKLKNSSDAVYSHSGCFSSKWGCYC